MDNYSLGEDIFLLGAGDKEAFLRIYNEYKKPVFTIIFRIVSNKEAAEDITQDFFFKLYQKPPSASIKNPRAWIFMSARNIAIDYLRSTKVHEELTEGIIHEEDMILKADMEKAISLLKREEREIITLHLNCELTFSEIALITGLSSPSVYRRYRKALKILRAYFEGG